VHQGTVEVIYPIFSWLKTPHVSTFSQFPANTHSFISIKSQTFGGEMTPASEVREQSTLDLYVIRTAGALGAMLPFDQIRRQSQQLMESRVQQGSD
jgi:hypothetical protein